jgi:formylglycine-generating enzyme required for sulfatase activity
MQADAKIEEARLRAEAEAKATAEKGRQYREFVRLAREELGVGDYARAMDLLVQAKAIESSREVSQLLDETRRLQHVTRAGEAEKKGALGKAAELYELALEIRSEDSTRERLEEVRRRLALSDSLAAADRLAGEGKWLEAKKAYAKALDLATGEERAGIEKRARSADQEIRYAEALGQAGAAVKKRAWKEAVAHARSALAVKSGDQAALAIIELAKDALGPEPEITNSIGMQFVLVPAGEFTMGSETGDDDERPVHRVHLDAYYIGKYEVTNAQFEQFSPAHRQKWKEYSPDDEMPVIAVSWDEAAAFCKWLSRKEGIEYRLPTEAEWERAARGTDGRLYPWGNEAPDAGRTYRCNYAPKKAPETWKLDGFELISPVGALPAGVSPVDCHDMAGNAWEWCFDWYGKTWYSGASASNPRGPDGGAKRVLRGGSITSNAMALRCANRLSKPSTFYEANIGFRCARAVRKGRLVAPLLEE